MIYTRKLTPHEVDLLGHNPIKRVNDIVTNALMNLDMPSNGIARVLASMSTVDSMTSAEIADVHMRLYGEGSIKESYVRVILRKLAISGLVRRENRGKYIKV